MIRSTHTVAVLDVSSPAYDEIAQKLRSAGYDHVFVDAGVIDMTGIGLARQDTNSNPMDVSPTSGHAS